MDRVFGTRRWRIVASMMAVVLSLGLTGCLAGPPTGSSPVPCAFPDVGGWNSFQTQFTRGLRPAANWVVSDSNNASIVSSPTGIASTSLGFAPNTFTGFTHPDQVINAVFINPQFGAPSVTNIQIINATGTYSFAGGLQRDYEFVGTNNGELSGIGTPVHGWYTALVVPNQDFWLTWLEIAHSNVWDGACGSLFAIRTYLSRIPQQPPSTQFEAGVVAAVEASELPIP